MALFRTEVLFDAGTGLFFMELYYPEEATSPEFVSDPIYGSPEEAERDAPSVFRQVLTAQVSDALA